MKNHENLDFLFFFKLHPGMFPGIWGDSWRSGELPRVPQRFLQAPPLALGVPHDA